MTTKIIYHMIKKDVPCCDGFAAAWVAHKAHPDAQIVGCWYQCEEKDLPVVEVGDKLIIVDFSFPLEILQKWTAVGADILLIDHHKTALEHLGDILSFAKQIRGDFVFDLNECGATLAWKYFFPSKPMPLFLQYVRDRDLWEKKMWMSDAIHTVVGKLGRTFDLFDHLAIEESEQLFEALAGLGYVLMKPKLKAIAEAVRRAGFAEVGGHSIPVVRLEKHEDYLTSDICEELYTNQFPEAQFVGCLTSDGTMSLRSNKNNPDGGFDVSSIAKELGGGGHRNAAGFRL